MTTDKEVSKIEVEVEGNMEEKRELNNNNQQFSYYNFFSFEDSKDWSENGLKPETCVPTS